MSEDYRNRVDAFCKDALGGHTDEYVFNALLQVNPNVVNHGPNLPRPGQSNLADITRAAQEQTLRVRGLGSDGKAGHSPTCIEALHRSCHIKANGIHN